jgi:hypothetical protein
MTFHYGSEQSEPADVQRVIYRMWRMNVDREHVKGAGNNVKGAIKDTAGRSEAPN